MIHIFFSYAIEDLYRVKPLVEALEARGWTVFWDRTIPAGRTWREVIGNALDKAQCVLVAWSETSIQSRWVQEEADSGLERGVLVPILIDAVRPPIGFRGIQAADLTLWDPREPSPAFDKLLNDISTITSPDLAGVDQEQKIHEFKTKPEGTRKKDRAEEAPSTKVSTPKSNTKEYEDRSRVGKPLRRRFINWTRKKILLAMILTVVAVLIGWVTYVSITKKILPQPSQVITTYSVVITALPTNVNAGAKVHPNLMILELHGGKEPQLLQIMNYPVSKTFIWSPDIGGDVILKISVGETLLTKKYTGKLSFPTFLREFSGGYHIFRPGDFSASESANLKNYGIEFINVTFMFNGADEIKNKYF